MKIPIFQLVILKIPVEKDVRVDLKKKLKSNNWVDMNFEERNFNLITKKMFDPKSKNRIKNKDHTKTNFKN